METQAPTKPRHSRKLLKVLGISLLSIFFVLLLAIIIIGVIAYKRLTAFTSAGATTPNQIFSLIQTARKTPVPWQNNRLTFLLLGTDAMQNRGNQTVLTDTMLLASLNKNGPVLSMYSLPRDTWSAEYKTKINALYAYGAERYPNEPERFPREVVAQMTGVNPQFTIVLDMATVQKIIDALGGVEVDVAEAFTDPQFPREDVDVRTVRDPKLLYKTVSFEAGKQWMNGQRAMEFMRSRHSVGEQGTDTARGSRQQQVLMALFQRLQNIRMFVDHPEVAGTLYQIYQERFQRSLPLETVIALGLELRTNIQQLRITQATASTLPQDPKGVLEHPKDGKPYDNQWVYVVRNTKEFQKEVKQKLGLE